MQRTYGRCLTIWEEIIIAFYCCSYFRNLVCEVQVCENSNGIMNL